MSKTTLDQLLEAVTEMDDLAQSAFRQIASMAQLGMLAAQPVKPLLTGGLEP